MKKYFTLLLVVVSFQPIISQHYQQIPIHKQWQIKSYAPGNASINNLQMSEGWIPAQNMPAMVPDILLQNKVIENPWLPGKAAEYQWIAESDWLYHTQFTVEELKTPAYLHFKGLDGIVDIYLNGQKIASQQNMFMPLRIEVSKRIKNNNQLVLHFHSVFEQSENGRKPIKEWNGKKVRRPNQSYINYLGPNPCFSRVGVFHDVFLEITQGSEITSLMAGSALSNNYMDGTVDIHFEGRSLADNVQVEAVLIDKNGTPASTKKIKVNVDKETFKGKLSLEISNPNLWWPRGYGNQALYKAEINLLVNGKKHQTIQKTIGFRSIEMTEPLHYTCNGKPIRLWGGCWVTPDFTTAVWDQQRAEKLFDLAENANFNSFRVWGVVEGPPDAFYELANERGFLIWQDFVNMPLGPGDESRETYRTEVPHYVKRLKNHPSIFIWCGGNENALWHHSEYNGKLENRGDWPGVEATNEIKAIIEQLDPNRWFFPTSPYYGIDPNDPKHGNTHGYTNMWFVPGYDYLNFASEDTRISAPVMHSCQKFMPPESIYPENYSPVFTNNTIYPYPETWLDYTTSTSWKKTGPVEQFYDATDAQSLIYRIGMAESQYYRETIERQRWGRPATDTSGYRQCGGYLVWKFNDSWPQIYSSKVDYFLEPKHAYYALKEAYAPIHISFDMGSYIYLWAVNDSPKTFTGTIHFQLFHIDKNIIRKEITRPITIQPDESLVAINLYQEGIGSFRDEHVLVGTLTDENGETVATSYKLADIERNVVFPNANPEVKIEGNTLLITTDKFAKSIVLTGNANGNKSGWFFSDNYFDLIPGKTKKVEILGNHTSGIISVKPFYSEHKTVIDYIK